VRKAPPHTPPTWGLRPEPPDRSVEHQAGLQVKIRGEARGTLQDRRARSSRLLALASGSSAVPLSSSTCQLLLRLLPALVRSGNVAAEHSARGATSKAYAKPEFINMCKVCVLVVYGACKGKDRTQVSSSRCISNLVHYIEKCRLILNSPLSAGAPR
jgi:hypothetical protein